MNFCCKPFENLVENMGKRGSSVLLLSKMGFTFFCLQSRGYDFEDVKGLGGRAGGIPVKVNVVSETGIHYCPFCGLELKKWLARHKKEAEELAERSKVFIMEFPANSSDGNQ